MIKRIGLDSLPAVTRDEALEFMVHHLQLAEIYYQNVVHDPIAVYSEVERIMLQEQPVGHTPPELIAARPWLAALDAYFEQLKREQGN